MAFYCTTMLSMALELAAEDPAYEDIASKFFEHFVAITDAMNTLGGTGLWDEEDGFYYDQLHVDGRSHPASIRSMVGSSRSSRSRCWRTRSIDAAGVPEADAVVPREPARTSRGTSLHGAPGDGGRPGHRLLAVPSAERLLRVLRYLLDEGEFLSLRDPLLSRLYRAPLRLPARRRGTPGDYVPGDRIPGCSAGTRTGEVRSGSP